MSIEQALNDFIRSLNNLTDAMSRAYAEQTKSLGGRVQAHLEVHQQFFGAAHLMNCPEWQKRLLHALYVNWSPIAPIEPMVSRPRLSLFSLLEKVDNHADAD